MLQFGWSTLLLLFPTLAVPVPILRWLYREHQLQLVSSFQFLIDYYLVWSSGRDYVIRLFLKIPENFLHLNLQERFLVNTIYSYGQMSISCTIPSGSHCPPNRIYSYILSVLICRIRLLCDWSFRITIIIIIIIYSLEFFTSMLADGFSLEIEWQQVSSSL